MLRRSKPNLSRAVAHLVLSQDPSDRCLTELEWEHALEIALNERCATNAPYAAYLHTDRNHHHLHVFMLRIRHDGSVVSDSHDYVKNMAAARRIEAALHLKSPTPKLASDRARSFDKTLILESRANRLGIELTDVQRLAGQINDAQIVAQSPEHLQQLLHSVGVQVEYTRHIRSNLITGWKVRLESQGSEWIKGAEIAADRSLTWPALARKKGWSLPANRAGVVNPLVSINPS